MSPSLNPPAPGTSRDLRLDSLRGLMLVGMAMNHIASPLHVLTDHPLGYTSAAEGFVFISGLVAGLVYTRRRARLGRAAVTQASRARACTIYLCHVALFAGLLLWTNAYVAITGVLPGNAPPAMADDRLASLAAGILLVDQPPLLDILPIYVGFMLLLPAVLTALDQGRHRLVLLLSGGAWFLTNLFYPGVPYVHGVVQVGAFYFGAWQLLFVIGATSGHGWATERPPLRAQLTRPVWLVAAVAVCAGGFLVRHAYMPMPFATFEDWVNKNNLAPARLLNTLALLLLVHAAFVRWPRRFAWRPLAFLGRHSLLVFGTHVAVAWLFFAFPQFVASTPAQRWLGTGLMLAAMAAAAWGGEQVKSPAPSRALALKAKG